MKKTDGRELLFDLNIFSSRRSRLLSIFEKRLNEPQELCVVYTPNPEQIVQSRGNKKFKQVLQQADLLLPDGIGLVWASKILALFGRAKPLSERIAGVDVVRDLLGMAHQRGLDVLVIGGREYSPEDYFAYDGAKINWTPGYKNVSQPTPSEDKLLKLKIKQLQPDLVLVAFGAPAQELWIDRNRSLLSKSGVSIAMAVGGSFDYLLRRVPRAPYWFRKLGLEWLFRLIIEPWRLKRQLRIISFLGLVIKEIFSY
ncbi:MAG: WecB/TagA/CpsF family glycosyltransferase [Candidatus Pacebacteria bacterium]|jgi:N-acetylglucosaminyldiphosphoundecaprenol N-acetyl-beta-D-mannosaminyltransferase|nr:WecB/TagA/CpsF family glycosyltransferase [Candidatus Paceibacterota bacterium]MBT3511786.1 WecB/TagA/CpsF family glycosyltransferase [Candidatus Paceibacterota bacterium]MBT4005110.1 WecB/TagA/CpsF family glycosyltransferase [Candidatus Paceibacterota bacterium]MBT4358888.1 WecB/TagA/CpsF family glycosyltransferase [Candidatus Paceibacterota bacterium]MBT4681218.1 WecB/TagA/CpsF family glycosyltransferase [Candidatus Paceibacterota bacterium]